MYWLANDWRVRAYSYYESIGYEQAVSSIEQRLTQTAGQERFYWVRVREALDKVAG